MIRYCKTPNSFHLESGVAKMDRVGQGRMNGSFRVNRVANMEKREIENKRNNCHPC